MSLLPTQILPETEPIGTRNEDGSITLTHNWYLLLYNLTTQAFGNQAPESPTVITVGASPYLYTPPSAGSIAVSGGTVSAIAILRQGIETVTGLTSGLIPVSTGDQVIVTYTSTPSMTFLPS